MAIISWKTNAAQLGIPPKILKGTVTQVEGKDLWLYPYSQDDQFWAGGINPKYYTFVITFNITATYHNSNLTRLPNYYDGFDIEVGDFVGGITNNKFLQVVQLLNKNSDQIVAICEDRLRYNTFLYDNPAIDAGEEVIFFQINERGVPVVDPVPPVPVPPPPPPPAYAGGVPTPTPPLLP